jgi:RHS repeat-associated protein
VCGGTCSYRNVAYDRWGTQWITANGGLPNPTLATTTNNYNPATNYRYDEAYDGAGNQYSVDGLAAYYDAENRLYQLTNPTSGTSETFLYDGSGRRVQKSYSGNATSYVYDALGFLVAEYAGSAVSKEYIPFGSQVIAVENASGTPCQTCYLNYDHLGSVRLVTDQNANVVARHDYVPYGEEISPPYAGRTAPFGNTDYVNPRFTGQMRDAESGLDFFNARYFGPGLGRFVSPDPMNAGADVGNPQSWNGYLYGLGNPVVYTDPSGMFGEKPPAAPVSPTQLCTILITGGENLPQAADPCLPSVASTYGAPSGSGATGSSSSGSPSGSPAKNAIHIGNYPTLDCDGYRAVRSILPQTAKQGIEFGGFLYQNRNGRYSYSNPVAGAPTSIPDLFKVPQALVSGIVGWFHTHPLVPGFNNDRFSGSDLLITRREGPGYLGTASGRILKLAIDPKGFPHTTDVDKGACQAP